MAEGEEMKVSWADVNNTETPGPFPILDGVVVIKDRHIGIWKSEPTALFELVPLGTLGDGVRYALAGYEVPSQ